MEKNARQIRIGSIIAYIQMAISAIISIAYTPLMTRLLGQQEYGLYQTIASTVTMLSLLNLGFSSSYIRYYSIYRQKEDNASISKLNGMFLTIFLILGFVAFSSGIFLSQHLNLIFASGLTTYEYHVAKILMVLLSINLAVSFPMTVFVCIISANENFIFLKLIQVFKTVGSPLLTLPFLYMGYKSIAMVSVIVIISLFTDMFNMLYAITKLKARFIFGRFDRILFKNLLIYTSFIAINMVVDQVNWNIDKIILGRFQGTSEVAIYSIGFSLFQYYQMFSISISNLFAPRIHNMVNNTKKDFNIQKKELTQLFIKVGRIQFVVLGLVSTGLFFFGKEFIVRYWVGSLYSKSYIVMIILVFSSTIDLIQNIGIEIQRAQNLHKYRSYIYVLMALLNLVLSIILCQKYGAIGSVIGTALSFVVANGIVINIFYYKRCNIDVLLFWKNIVSMLKGFIIPLIFGFIYMNMFSNKNIVLFLSGVIIYTLLYFLSIYLFTLNTYEKNTIKKYIKR